MASQKSNPSETPEFESPYRREAQESMSRAPEPHAYARRGMMPSGEMIRRSLLWITIGVLAISVLWFLLGVNDIIDTWFRSQWVPVARSVVALAIIALCLFVMMRLTRRP